MTEACPKPCSGVNPWDIPLLGSATRPNWLSVCQSPYAVPQTHGEKAVIWRL
jgi:hypothetical protein